MEFLSGEQHLQHLEGFIWQEGLTSNSRPCSCSDTAPQVPTKIPLVSGYKGCSWGHLQMPVFVCARLGPVKTLCHEMLQMSFAVFLG